MAADEKLYFELGSRAGRDKPALKAWLDTFDSDVKSVYQKLSTGLQVKKGMTRELLWLERQEINVRVGMAQVELQRAQEQLFDKLGIGAERERLFPVHLVRKDTVNVYLPIVFMYFLRGLNQPGRRYATVDFDKAVYGGPGGQHVVWFPAFCFGPEVVRHSAPVPTAIKDYLRSGAPGFDPAAIYDTSVTHIRESRVPVTRSYRQTGVTGRCGHYAEVVNVGGASELFLLMDSFSNSALARDNPAMAAVFFEETRVHESMHYLLRTDCLPKERSVTFKLNDAEVSKRLLNEGQASIASIAVAAHSRQPDWATVLEWNLNLSKFREYRLISDIFVDKLLRRIAARQGAALPGKLAKFDRDDGDAGKLLVANTTVDEVADAAAEALKTLETSMNSCKTTPSTKLTNL